MAQAVPTILARIVEHKRTELAAATEPLPALEQRAAARRAEVRPFAAALRARRPAVIAEIKKASPSKGVLQPDFDPVRIARTYADGGAACLSVLTDERFFQGSLDDLESARSACSLPVLRKDFTIDERQILEAAAHGASAILLIAAILTTGEMRRFRELATSLGLDSLVEVHDGEELDRAIDSGAEIIGVNSRNLHDFSVTLDTPVRLAARMPAGVLTVAESGIHSPGDVRLLMDAGYQAFLVGEHLMKSADPAAALRALALA